MTNVIQFPVVHRGEDTGVPSSVEEIKAQADNLRHIWINEMCEVMVSTLVQQMEAGGFHIMADEHNKDFGFLIESVRSALCKTIGMYHPFQEVSEKIMETHEDLEGVLVIADSISVKFDHEKNPNESPEAETSPEVV